MPGINHGIFENKPGVLSDKPFHKYLKSRRLNQDFFKVGGIRAPIRRLPPDTDLHLTSPEGPGLLNHRRIVTCSDFPTAFPFCPSSAPPRPCRAAALAKADK